MGAPNRSPKTAQTIAPTASIGQKEKWSWTMSAWPGTSIRLTWPSQASGAQAADHSGLSWPEAAIP